MFEVIDAISSYGHKVTSVVELSKAPCFSRQYSSITDAVSDGVKNMDIQKVSLTTMNVLLPKGQKQISWVLDATASQSVHSPCLSDRSMVHAPNSVPGNKPITLGHCYSALAYHPQHDDHWLVPVSIERVPSDQKSNEHGMKQLGQIIEAMDDDYLHISVGDSLYGTLNCRKQSSQYNNLVHIARLRQNRNLWTNPNEAHQGKGRRKVFGDKLSLKDLLGKNNWDGESQIRLHANTDDEITLNIKVQRNLLFRGDREFRGEKHPLDVYCVTAENKDGQCIYKRPLWLGVFGERRDELELKQVASYYRKRYDIEHFFRFGKNKLLMTRYQTPDTDNKERWMLLSMLAYQQLYLGRELTLSSAEPWERYLPSFKEKKANQSATPTMTQRGFGNLINEIGTPAKTAVPRGQPIGRIVGMLQNKRPTHDIKFKGLAGKKQAKAIKSGSENAPLVTKPKKFDVLVKQLKNELEKSKITPEDFCQKLLEGT